MLATLLIFAIHIQAGPAKLTAQVLSEQTNTSVIWAEGEPGQVQTKALVGHFSVVSAWCALLDGSGLSFFITGRFVSVHKEIPSELNALCHNTPEGWGPDFVHPPVADWK